MKQLVLAVLGALCASGVTIGAPRPNTVLIPVDDMGWPDIGCHGAGIQTPNLDSRAAGGRRFRQFHNTTKCFSTRACLLPGTYAQQNGLDASHANTFRNVVTPGEVLREAGYHIHVSGKNHSYDNFPDRGFVHYDGLRDGACNHFNPGPDLPHRLQDRSGTLDRHGRSHSGIGSRQSVDPPGRESRFLPVGGRGVTRGAGRAYIRT